MADRPGSPIAAALPTAVAIPVAIRHDIGMDFRRTIVLSKFILLGCTVIQPALAAATPSLRVEWEIDRERVYRYEVFPVVLRMEYPDSMTLVQLQVSGLPGADQLRVNNFERILPDERKPVEDGQTRVITRYRAEAMAPRAGTIALNPHLDYIVVERRTQDYFRTVRVESSGRVTPDALRLDVLELPEFGQPLDFTGAVGRFEMTASLEYDAPVVPGSLLVLRSEIAGEGNFENVHAPQPPMLEVPVWRVYPPRRVEQTAHSVKHERTIVPLNSGHNVFPEIRFSYFDPESEAYIVLTNGPFRVFVEDRETMTTK